MAHVKLIQNPSLLRAAYFVDAPVGRGCANKRDDVLLVQFLLRSLWGRQAPGETGIIVGAPGSPPLQVDGHCGNSTVLAIRHFQQWYWRESNIDRTDGKVHPVPAGTTDHAGPRRGQIYTIIGLNTAYGGVFGTDQHALVHRAPGFPAELKTRFYA